MMGIRISIESLIDMKLTPIKNHHVLKAGEQIAQMGIPESYIHNYYWVKLPNGEEYPFKHLVRTAYKLTNGNEDIDLKFESNEGYRDYIKSLGFEITYYKEDINFFKRQELELFEELAGTPYRSDNHENVRKSQLIKPLVKKVNKWAERLLIEDFTFKKDNHWQWSGTFKSYLWLRLYRKEDSGLVFFKLGVNEYGTLFLGIDCRRSNHTGGTATIVSGQNLIAFDEYLKGSDYAEQEISKNDIENYGWDQLINWSQVFLYRFAPLYDELERIVSSKAPEQSKPILSNNLEFCQPPEKTRSYVNRARTYRGYTTDWSKKHFNSTRLGLEGEKLVIRLEQEKLRSLGLGELADKVNKRLDGEGFDILSFDENGDEIHIEVKTTMGSIEEPFFMSANEISYFREYPEKYFLYRLFNFSFSTNSAGCYKLNSTDLNDVEFNATNYEVSILGKG